MGATFVAKSQCRAIYRNFYAEFEIKAVGLNVATERVKTKGVKFLVDAASDVGGVTRICGDGRFNTLWQDASCGESCNE
jgi:hypothetical protein